MIESDLNPISDYTITVGRYSKKEKAITVTIPITKEMLSLADKPLESLIKKFSYVGIQMVAKRLKGKIDADLLAIEELSSKLLAAI